MILNVKIFKTHPGAVLPERKSLEAAGYDLHALEGFSLRPGNRVVVRTGLVVQPPPGFHTEVLARSGLAYKHGIFLTNNVGLIDRDFAGSADELMVMLYRVLSAEEVIHFEAGDRIAQMVFRRTELFNLQEVFSPPIEDSRGGLGSTGVK